MAIRVSLLEGTRLAARADKKRRRPPILHKRRLAKPLLSKVSLRPLNNQRVRRDRRQVKGKRT
jgi:hypothetical protein